MSGDFDFLPTSKMFQTTVMGRRDEEGNGLARTPFLRKAVRKELSHCLGVQVVKLCFFYRKPQLAVCFADLSHADENLLNYHLSWEANLVDYLCCKDSGTGLAT